METYVTIPITLPISVAALLWQEYAWAPGSRDLAVSRCLERHLHGIADRAAETDHRTKTARDLAQVECIAAQRAYEATHGGSRMTMHLRLPGHPEPHTLITPAGQTMEACDRCLSASIEHGDRGLRRCLDCGDTWHTDRAAEDSI